LKAIKKDYIQISHLNAQISSTRDPIGKNISGPKAVTVKR